MRKSLIRTASVALAAALCFNAIPLTGCESKKEPAKPMPKPAPAPAPAAPAPAPAPAK